MRVWISAGTLFVLAACSGFNDDEGMFVNKADDYLDATERHGLVIPEDLDPFRVQDPFPIPSSPVQSNPEFYPGRPPQPSALYANDNRDEVRLQRLGGRVWLAVPESPDTVWPKIKQFLAENGVNVVREVGRDGRLDSEWMIIENTTYRDVVRMTLRDERDAAAVSEGRDRIMIRVERGMRERTAEVHLRHENDADGMDDPSRPFNSIVSDIVTVEREMLNEIGAYIAAKVAEQTVSMVAQEISSGAKSEVIRNPDGVPTLQLYLDSERAWAAIGQALNRAEVDVTNQDRGEGKYYVVISDSFLAGERRGFFKRLFSGRGKNKKKTADNLQVALSQSDERTFSVVILDENARHIDRELSQELLTMIREFAS
ncbi:MAG: hypothetical protein CMQ49_02775 [Gammaproteobacteria bacterium]|nr:hypothetical protein [Gammaproteobacteria bacterium]|tara:strand:+ start:32 stop:1144 length:1113 start_codon:yes stop_codon:yes gene_type:complete